MPRGDPGGASRKALPRGWPRTAPAICWSWVDGRWVRVDGGEYDAMVTSAAQRTSNTRDGVAPNARLGTRRLDPAPGARFVVTLKDGDPGSEWARLHPN